MSEGVWDCGYLSLSSEIQEALEAPPPGPERIRIEIVADELGRKVAVDYKADMAYFDLQVRDIHRTVEVTDGCIADYAIDGSLVGVEVFLVRGAALLEDVAALRRLLE